MESKAEMQYVVAQYQATGEGITLLIMIKKSYPREIEGEIRSSKFVAAYDFAQRFGSHYIPYAQNLPKDEFMEQYGHWLPEPMKKNLEKEFGIISFSQEFHIG